MTDIKQKTKEVLYLFRDLWCQNIDLSQIDEFIEDQFAGERHKDQCPEINHDPVVVNEIEPDFDAMRVQQAKERVYWQKRCEAAEAFIDANVMENIGERYHTWQTLKSQSPNQTG